MIKINVPNVECKMCDGDGFNYEVNPYTRNTIEVPCGCAVLNTSDVKFFIDSSYFGVDMTDELATQFLEWCLPRTESVEMEKADDMFGEFLKDVESDKYDPDAHYQNWFSA